MANAVDLRTPSLPNILIYPYEIVKIDAEPNYEAVKEPNDFLLYFYEKGCVGKYGIRCFFTPIGPIPGPPPPCGIAKVLWRFK